MPKTVDNVYLPKSPLCLWLKDSRIFSTLSYLYSAAFPTQSDRAVSRPGPLHSLRGPASLLAALRIPATMSAVAAVSG